MDGAGIEKQGQKEGVSPTSPHLIEQIALFREGFEREIYTGIPPTQWMDVYTTNLIRQPANVQALKPQFDVVVNHLLETRHSLDVFWQANVVDPIEERGYEFSNQAEAAKLFELTYGFTPSSPVDATRGLVDLEFYVGRDDFDLAMGSISVTKDVMGIADPNTAPFPVIVLDRDGERLDHTLAHEWRHVQDQSLFIATSSLDKAVNFLPMQEADVVGGEILGEFTSITGGKEGLINKDEAAIAYFKDGFAQYASKWGDYVYRHISNVEGPYNKDGNVAKVREGVDAIVDLITWYEERFPDYNSVRIASNVLSQFPVERWKAVVRLLKKGSNNSSQQSV